MAEPRRRFKFLKELAAGGFGKVYVAEMITGDNFSTVVAIKLLHGKWTGNDEIVMRSRDEARLLGKLRHRNIVRVEDLTSIQGQCAVVMEYLQGIDLKNASNALRDRGQVFPRKAVFESLSAIASALHAAYNHVPLQGGQPLRVIHRDIKPSNAFVTIDGDVKVLDFGTAKATFQEREAHTQALAFGSAAYMAPERLLGEDESKPSGDIFSLGVTAYELLALDSYGKIHLRPERFEKTVAEKLEAIDLSSLNESIRAEALELLRLMLSYDPDKRPSAEECIEICDTLAEQASDAGLKRFARELVRPVYESAEPEQDPSDPFTGTMLFEDTSSFAGPRVTTDVFSAGQPVAPAAEEPVGDPPSEESPFKVPEDLKDPVPGGGSHEIALGAAPAAEPARTSAPRPKSMAGEPLPNGTLAPPAKEITGPRAKNTSVPPASTSSPRPKSTSVPPANTSAPRPKETSAPRPKETSAPRPKETSAPRPREVEDAGEAPKSGGGLGKVLVGLVLLGVLGVVGLGGAFFLLSGNGDGEKVADVDKTAGGAKITGASNPNLKSGADDLDWSPNTDGKGGVILQVPGGASEVLVSGLGRREEWDGSKNLRLKDLEPGVLRGKVKPAAGGPAVMADFSVEAGKTCVYAFKGDTWEKSECR
ncbi:MAG: serine/threonine protein kinase [Myxococcota bacterium]